jgi:putative ATP-dependent endonuclease of OLD family
LKNLILINNQEIFPLSSLSEETYSFFEKLPGFETLRLLLCKKAILVEGPSDELIIQRAFMDKNENTLPIEKEIDIISVGLTFKRFLEVADLIKKPVAVVTDNDGDYKNKIKKKYKEYKHSETIEIFADNRNVLKTLEPQIVDANSAQLNKIRKILEIDNDKYPTAKSISDYMESKKTESALRIFKSSKSINYPDYINSVIEWCNE